MYQSRFGLWREVRLSTNQRCRNQTSLLPRYVGQHQHDRFVPVLARAWRPAAVALHARVPLVPAYYEGPAVESYILPFSLAAREDQNDFAVLQNIDCGIDRTRRRVRTINRNGTAVLQDPFCQRRTEELLFRHVAQLPWIDGVGHPHAVRPADVIARDDRSLFRQAEAPAVGG
jgi:hypothetical protein